MANTFVGTLGSIVVTSTTGATLINVRRWSATINRDNHDTTPFIADATNANMETNLGGLVDLTGTFEGFLDGTTPIADADFDTIIQAESAFVLHYYNVTGAGNSMAITFNGFLTELIPQVSTADVNKYTGAFVSSGTIAFVANA